MPYRLLIFDFDGTLADSFGWFKRVFNELADEFGFRRVTPEEFDTLRGHDAKRLLKHVGLPLWKVPAVAARARAMQKRDLHRIALFPGVAPTLRELARRGVALAVVSSNAEENIRAVLGPDVAPLVAHYACGTSLFGKASKIRGVIKRAGVPHDQTLCVGDEIRDIDAARSARAASAAVAWGYADVQALRAASPTIVLNRFEDLLDHAG